MADIHLNHKNVGRILRRRFEGKVNDLAQKITDKVNATDFGDDAPDDPAFMEPYTTDRSAAGVLVRSELQARDGALTRAAADLGLAVHSKEGKS